MSRYITRMMGLYRPEELLINIKVEKLTCVSPAYFDTIYLEFDRGSKV